jgi:hypothetical protein
MVDQAEYTHIRGTMFDLLRLLAVEDTDMSNDWIHNLDEHQVRAVAALALVGLRHHIAAIAATTVSTRSELQHIDWLEQSDWLRIQ